MTRPSQARDHEPIDRIGRMSPRYVEDAHGKTGVGANVPDTFHVRGRLTMPDLQIPADVDEA